MREKDGMLEERDTSLISAAEDQGARNPAFMGCEDRRRAERFPFLGGEVFLFVDGDQRFRLRLRDLCSLGLSGLTDAPIGIGKTVIVQLEEMLMPAAKVTWTRFAMTGLSFINPLPRARLNRLRERQAAGAAWSPAMRAGSDLHGWWTDVGAHAQGRRARLDAGGHSYPLPR